MSGTDPSRGTRASVADASSRAFDADAAPVQPVRDASTISFVDDGGKLAAKTVGWPQLLVVMECRRPLAGGARLSLFEARAVEVGRGDARGWHLQDRDGVPTLRVSIPDAQMSREHFRLVRDGERWLLEDRGSKNGTWLDGAACSLAPVGSGALIEAGATVLSLRTDRCTVADIRADRDYQPAQSRVLRTLDLGLERAFEGLARLAGSRVPLLVHGETGTGKELVARAIHELSGRPGRLVAINCGALPEALIESELFGHRRGAFSGATEDRPGLIRQADGGTLLLDEIAELSEPSQASLLRVLQEQEVRPVGDTAAVPVDVRVVAATHQDLAARVATGRFREDLFARLVGHTIALPPLRARRHDLGTIIAALLPDLCARPERVTFRRAAFRALWHHPFPRNIRELEQALAAALALAGDGEIGPDHLPPEIALAGPPGGEGLATGDRQLHDQLVATLRASRGNVSQTARVLGKAPVQIRRWCRRFGIDVDQFRR